MSAQLPTPLSIAVPPSGTLSAGAQIYGFGENSQRLLARGNLDALNNRPIGYFDAGVGSAFVELIAGLPASSVDNVVWERSTGTPMSCFFVQNNAAGGQSVLWQALINPFNGSYNGSVQLPQLSTSATETWTLDGIQTGNQVFFLRRTSGTGANVFRCGTSGSPVLMTASSAARALSPLAVINVPLPSGVTLSQLAYLTVSGTGAQQITFLTYTSSGSTSSPVSYPVTPGNTLQDLTWISNRYLVARMSSTSTPNVAKLVRIDRQSPNPPNFIVDLTLPNADIESLRVSGDRQWLSFFTSPGVGAANERSAAVMRVTDGTTAQPGGAYTILMPLETWNFAQPPFVQQTSNPLNPSVVFAGQPPAGGAVSYYRASMVHDVSVVGRTVAAPAGMTFSFNVSANFVPVDEIWVLGLSFARATTPGPSNLVGEVLAPPVIVVGAPNQNASQTITLTTPVSPPFVSSSLYMQSAWLSQSALFVGRLTSLPIFQ